jgi:hypothetical protein
MMPTRRAASTSDRSARSPCLSILTGGPQRVDALEGLRQQFGHLAADLGDR